MTIDYDEQSSNWCNPWPMYTSCTYVKLVGNKYIHFQTCFMFSLWNFIINSMWFIESSPSECVLSLVFILQNIWTLKRTTKSIVRVFRWTRVLPFLYNWSWCMQKLYSEIHFEWNYGQDWRVYCVSIRFI